MTASTMPNHIRTALHCSATQHNNTQWLQAEALAGFHTTYYVESSRNVTDHKEKAENSGALFKKERASSR
jgi:hypothetical protein